MTPPEEAHTEELLPCPFCGNSGVVCSYKDSSMPEAAHWVRCDQTKSHHCDATIAPSNFSDGHWTRAEAIAAWNRRPSPPAGDLGEREAALPRDAPSDEQSAQNWVAGTTLDEAYQEGHSDGWEARTEAMVLEELNAESAKDAAYEERNRVVSALAFLFPSGIAKTDIPGWDPEWHGCVYIDLPTGQVSWHYHDRDAGLFVDLPPYTKPWDGHTTREKYDRLIHLSATKQVAAVAAEEQVRSEQGERATSSPPSPSPPSVLEEALEALLYQLDNDDIGGLVELEMERARTALSRYRSR